MTKKLKVMKERLQQYRDAERRILSGEQSYKIGTRQVMRPDLTAIQKEIKELESEIEALEKYGTTGGRIARAVPVD